MELKNDERIVVVNLEQCKEFFNTLLEQNGNRNPTFDKNDTSVSQSINTNTICIKEEIADSVFVKEGSSLETKIEIEEYDFYHNTTHVFGKTTCYYNKDNSNIQNDLDITSNCVNSAKEFDNFSSNELKQSIKVDSASISSADGDGDCSESINWKLDVKNDNNFVNRNQNHMLSEVSFSNVNESNSSEILSKAEIKQLERSTERQLKESVMVPLNNIKIFNFKGNVVEKCIQKKTIAELLGTAEELYIYVQQQDLYELQRTFKRESDTKYQRTVHIKENHKKVDKTKNMIETQCMTPVSIPDKILFKCNKCSYVTNIMASLKEHLLVHKSVEELKRTFRCASCPYVAKSRHRIISHMLVHIPAERQFIHKCPHCNFRAKQKRYIKNHIQRMHISQKVKNRIHMHTHLDSSQVAHPIYRCDKCPFQARYKFEVKKHLLTHKKREELPTFQCDKCEHRTTMKQYLRAHRKIMHTDPSEIDWKRCEKCKYKTKLLCNLKQHSIIHKKPEELEMFRCAQCSFSTKSKHYLKQHVAIHTNFYYNCPMCSFKTKHSRSLCQHKKNVH